MAQNISTNDHIIDLLVKGETDTTIAEIVGVPVSQVKEATRREVDRFRAMNRELRDKRAMQADLRLEELYRRMSKLLDEFYDVSPEILVERVKEISEIVRVMLMILARQAAMFGFDAEKKAAGKKTLQWLADEDVSAGALLEEAKRQGLRIPKSFDIAAPNGYS